MVHKAENKMVSVIIPTFNDSSDRLSRSIFSVINQTYRKIEIFIIDDGSKLPFAGLNKTIKDKRISWLPLKKNSGVAKARNHALTKAKGKYVAFLDTGDWWEKDKLSEQLKVFASTQFKDCILTYSDAQTHFPDGSIGKMVAKNKGRLYPQALVNVPVSGSCSSALLLTEVLLGVGGFYESEDIPEDKELWVQLSKVGSFDYISNLLVHIEVHLPSSRSFSAEKKKKPYLKFIELHETELKSYRLYKKAIANYHEQIGMKYYLSGDNKQSIVNWLKRICYNPSFTSFLDLIILIWSALTKKEYRVIRSKVYKTINKIRGKKI
ncbi:MAG: glycosyltransferase family 2 protein [Leptospirales bacterium]